MKSKLLPFLLLIMGISYSQNSDGAFEINQRSNQRTPLTAQQEDLIMQQVKLNVVKLQSTGVLKNIETTQQRGTQLLLQWPLQSNDPAYRETWIIYNYVDHDPNPSTVSDYNCGTRSFDGNEYTSIGLNPFGKYQNQSNTTSVNAATSGIITFKDVIHPETNCGETPGAFSNVIVIQNTDGTYALYVGIKENTATTKIVGDAVSAGEFLGFLGNAGYSNAYPELFFKLLDTDANGNAVIDPFMGTCNPGVATSWWAQQPAYVDSKVNTVFTHSDLPDFTTCPETTNFKEVFVKPDSVKMIGYFTDMIQGSTINFKLQRPSGSIAVNSTPTLSNTYHEGYYQFTKTTTTFNETGTWIARFTYNGTTFEHQFFYDALLGTTSNDKLSGIKLFPNPASGLVSIESEIEINYILLIDASGRIVLELKKDDTKVIDVAALSKGVYFIELHSDQGKTVRKIIKE